MRRGGGGGGGGGGRKGGRERLRERERGSLEGAKEGGRDWMGEEGGDLGRPGLSKLNTRWIFFSVFLSMFPSLAYLVG